MDCCTPPSTGLPVAWWLPVGITHHLYTEVAFDFDHWLELEYTKEWWSNRIHKAPAQSFLSAGCHLAAN